MMIGHNPCQMSHPSDFSAYCRCTCQRRKPPCQPLVGRPLQGRSASLLELLHRQHNTCLGKAVRPDSRPLCYCLARQHGPDLSLLLPRLRQEWDCEKNRHFDNVQIKPHSLKVCEWICSEGTADDPHHWDAVVANRTKGHGCPYCAGRRVSKRNSLATVAPDVAKSWCYEKNKGTPEDYTSRSHYKAAWACTACGNHWIAEIASRASSGTGCATCYNKRRGRRKDGSRRKHPTFTECNHALLSEWDHDRNAERGQFPQNITLGSHKPVHWVCRQCSLSILHRWVKTPNARTANQRGCPYCSGYAVCKCNSLATCCPEIAQDWDYSKNKAGPDEYTANSSKTGWWQNASRGSWQQIIQHRVYNWTRQQRNAIKQGELDLN